MRSQSVRPYALLLAYWLVASLAGCLFGAVASGARSIIPNFLRYGVGVGAFIAVLLAATYLYDRRILRRAGYLDDEQSPRDR